MILDLIQLDKSADMALYKQLFERLRDLIHGGQLQSGQKIPGTRVIARHLHIHRQTVVKAMNELMIQGWIEIKPGKGMVVHTTQDQNFKPWAVKEAGFKEKETLYIPENLNRSLVLSRNKYHLDDGLPDPRLVPIQEILSLYKEVYKSKNTYQVFQYDDTKGHIFLREVLAAYLSETRGLRIKAEEVMITRGLTQGLYLTINSFLKPGDSVAVPTLSWESANASFRYHGLRLIPIQMDSEGMVTEHLEEMAQKENFKMIYLTPHHQYPTTVIMSAQRRMSVLNLCRSKGIYLFEDDYDYDFHYSGLPLTPMAASDHGGHILYAGSLTKAVAPAFRVGYLVGRADQIDYLSRIRRMVDRQGDPVMELVAARLIKKGILQRCLRRNRKMYQERRDHFAGLLTSYFGDKIQFKLPEGGMSVWAQFPELESTTGLHLACKIKDLYIPDTQYPSPYSNYIRLGYASSEPNELDEAVRILHETYKQIQP